MVRDDVSDKLVHLTRGDSDEHAGRTFLKIVEERRLLGGTGFIRGRHKCICFSEAPVSKLAQILASPGAHDMRYKPFGVMVDKRWLFACGGRPVIYQPDSEYRLLHKDLQYRHVRYEPDTPADYTWEREWRIQADALELDPAVVTLVVPNRLWARWFIERHIAKLKRRAMLPGVTGTLGFDFEWHFVVLGDLGVALPPVSPPPLD